MIEPKISLALIVKGADNEAALLKRCLASIYPFVDAIYITSTYKKGEEPNAEVDKVCKEFNAHVSYFEWCNDFAKARNFNFSQVPKEYEFLLWCDADDIYRGLEKLKPTLAENPQIDAMAFWYLYAFDEYNQPTVVHKKSMLVRNDGCVEWVGKLHEDFKENRGLNVQFVEGIERLHLTSEERIQVAQKRNVEVSTGDYEEHPDDPRTYWNLANSYMGNKQDKEARDMFEKFLKLSQSHEEKYLAQMRVGMLEDEMNNREESIRALQIAIGMRPDYPDAYLQMGYVQFKYGNLDHAEYYLLNGLVKKPPYHSIIVYNPRDYDYNPMMLLSKVYFQKSRPDLALPMLQGCLKIYPESKYVAGLVKELEAEVKRLADVLVLVQKLTKLDDKDKIEKALKKVPVDLKSHPAICALRHRYFIKETSSGKDLVYYCYPTAFDWNPDLFKTRGFGGSEEAVVNLAKEWAKDGWNVTVYNSCGTEEMIRDGVTYKPHWEFNPKDKQDVLILWRSPKLLDYDVNASKVIVDLHDVVQSGEFTPKRLEKLYKVFVKTNFHRSLFPNVPDEKICIVPNGQDFELFNQEAVKDPMMICNTSSPDRSMDVAPEIFKRIKEQVPEARMKGCYGWGNYDDIHSGNEKMKAWKEKIVKEMEDAGIENLGRLTQKETAKLYLESNMLLFPSEFAEIDCITVKKAQACGALPVVTDFGALDESVQHGIKIHSEKTKDNWSKPFQFSFGVEDEKQKQQFVDAVVAQLRKPIEDRTEMKEWTRKFEWNKIAKQWTNQF